jgi:hypothetical protein
MKPCVRSVVLRNGCCGADESMMGRLGAVACYGRLM